MFCYQLSRSIQSRCPTAGNAGIARAGRLIFSADIGKVFWICYETITREAEYMLLDVVCEYDCFVVVHRWSVLADTKGEGPMAC